jgi:hypothetical protein
MYCTNPTGTGQKHVLHIYIQLKAVLQYAHSEREIWQKLYNQLASKLSNHTQKGILKIPGNSLHSEGGRCTGGGDKLREREWELFIQVVFTKCLTKSFTIMLQQEISCVNSQSAAFSTFEMAKQKLCAWMIHSLASPWTSKAVVLEWISYNPKAMHAMFQVYNASTQLGVSHIFITSRNEHQYRGV